VVHATLGEEGCEGSVLRQVNITRVLCVAVVPVGEYESGVGDGEAFSSGVLVIVSGAHDASHREAVAVQLQLVVVDDGEVDTEGVIGINVSGSLTPNLAVV